MSSKPTRVNLTNCSTIYTWTIEKDRLVKLQDGKRMESPRFSVGSDNNKFFKLGLFPAGKSPESTDYIAIYIRPAVIDIKNKVDKLLCKCSLSVIKEKQFFRKATLYQDFVANHFKPVGYSNFYKFEKIDHLISSENTLTIQCELEIVEEFKSSLNCSDIIDNKNQTIDKVNFDELLFNEEFSDVKIITSDGNTIPAHKNILAVASPVFKAMFTHDMLENEENSVKITDATANVVTEMLRFIYTGQIDAIETDTVIELLAVADMYQIDSLKNKCGKMLCADLSVENAIDILVAAHKYKAKFLEDEAIKFFTTHTQLLFNSEKMKKIDDPDLWVNLTQSIVRSQKNVSCPVCHPENHS